MGQVIGAGFASGFLTRAAFEAAAYFEHKAFQLRALGMAESDAAEVMEGAIERARTSPYVTTRDAVDDAVRSVMLGALTRP